MYIINNGKVNNYSKKDGCHPIKIWNKSAIIFCMIYYFNLVTDRLLRQNNTLLHERGDWYNLGNTNDIRELEKEIQEIFPELIITNHEMKCFTNRVITRYHFIAKFDIKKEAYNEDFKQTMISFFKLKGII